eukprot:3474186-Pyramimonas_sp.AAC.1
MRARGQRAATVEARTGTLRHLLRAMETEPKRLDIPCVRDYCMKLCLPPMLSPSAMRCLNATPCLDGDPQCCLTCLFWSMNSRQRRPIEN